MGRVVANFDYELPLWKSGFDVIGIDEVGRGAFAGPVGVGGVVFPNALNNKKKKYLLSLGINDSKKLTKKKREELSFIIKNEAIGYFVELIDVLVVNKVGVGKATELGMIEVVKKAKIKMQKAKLFALIDGFEVKGLENSQKAIIKGDCLSLSIAAASIIAKVERDNFMEKIATDFPHYGFEQNKGYGTSSHRKALLELGACKEHRVQFIRNYI